MPQEGNIPKILQRIESHWVSCHENQSQIDTRDGVHCR